MSTISGEFMKTFEKEWINVDTKLSQIPGKVFISTLSTYSQEHYKKAITTKAEKRSFSMLRTTSKM